MAKAIVIAAPSSGSGKTVVTLGILRALRNRGLKVASAKVGPDYIDPRFHEAATGRPCFNLDPWAMSDGTLACYLRHLAGDADTIVIEGVMGLFDGPACGGSSTADLAARFNLPVALVIDCGSMGQSVAAIARGFGETAGIDRIATLILNKVASDKHERILCGALGDEWSVLGGLRRDAALALPSRHLGLVQASERSDLEEFLEKAASLADRSLNLDGFLGLARTPKIRHPVSRPFAALGTNIAVASDIAFAFAYPHMLHDWEVGGATISRFSPLADEPPDESADAIFLPGGYPELYAERLSTCSGFLDGLRLAAKRGALIYGECGGFMVLGDYIIDKDGRKRAMAGLLPLGTSFADRKLHLGYRILEPLSGAPFPLPMRGHEFHYSMIDWQGEADPLFEASDASGTGLGKIGLRRANVMGSYAHVIAPESE
ncbi:MAG: cobyrinate a,c-diamide synthase [Rhizobiales bacterium]|nr:cobyrinate a,c-diamide synthase [Hyphomicrobiales bacterium]